MPNINKANRQVCDVDIRSLDRKPVLFFETANTTTQVFRHRLTSASPQQVADILIQLYFALFRVIEQYLSLIHI